MVPREPSTALELLPRVLAGDADARERFFERVYGRVLAMVRARMGSGLRRFYESGDVVQEALVQALRSLPGTAFEDEQALLSWLATVVENRLRDLSKFHGAQKREAGRERREVSLDPEQQGLLAAQAGADRSPGPATLADAGERQLRLQAALGALDPKRARAIELRSLGLAWSEVAERLELPSEGAARMLHARALVDLGRALEAEGLGET